MRPSSAVEPATPVLTSFRPTPPACGRRTLDRARTIDTSTVRFIHHGCCRVEYPRFSSSGHAREDEFRVGNSGRRYERHAAVTRFAPHETGVRGSQDERVAGQPEQALDVRGTAG